jgi:YopX protein
MVAYHKMERIVKFRAWNGKSFWYDFVLDSDGAQITETGDRYSLEDDNIILNQYTGKDDADDVEIYEDDILEGDYRVVWNNDRNGWAKTDRAGVVYELEDEEIVIGNIYETK